MLASCGKKKEPVRNRRLLGFPRYCGYGIEAV
jgi:hypothetical protein